jgi:hypothetical protein
MIGFWKKRTAALTKVDGTKNNGIAIIRMAFLASIPNPRENFTYKWAIRITSQAEMQSTTDLLNRDTSTFIYHVLFRSYLNITLIL